MRKKYLIFIAVVVSVVFFDQWTKAYVCSAMHLYDSQVVIENLLSITYIMNAGAAFGFLAQAPPLFRSLFFNLAALAAMGLIIYYLRKSRDDEPLLILALSLILGGALGNLIDRLRFGAVVDFIDVYWKTYHWPAFNVADAAISLGAMLMILEILKRGKVERALT